MSAILVIFFILWVIGGIIKVIDGEPPVSGNNEFEIKVQEGRLNPEDPESSFIYEIMGRGLFPVSRTTNIGFTTSLFDDSGAKPEPVLSMLEYFQEENSPAYGHTIEGIEVSPGYQLRDWVRVGILLPEVIIPPYSGTRKLTAVLRVVDMDNQPDIQFGCLDPNPGCLWTGAQTITHTFTEKGYQESAEHRDESRCIALKMGVAVAMADGSFDDSEGHVLKQWIIQAIKPFSDEKQAELKELYNTAMKEGFEEAKMGNLALSSLTERLNEIGEKATRCEAVELCFKIMAADGIADSEEMTMINRIASSLGLEKAEVEKIRDPIIIKLNAEITTETSAEEILGIDRNWPKDKLKRFLREEYQKWNNRLNVLPEGNERANAQRMLELIGETRKKYFP